MKINLESNCSETRRGGWPDLELPLVPEGSPVSAAEHELLLDLAQDAIIACDSANHRIRYWNKGAERIFGWTAEEALGWDVRKLMPMEESAVEEQVSKGLVARGQWAGELKYRSKDGRVITTMARVTIGRDAEHCAQPLYLVLTDVTDQKKVEEQFLRAQRLESIGELAGGIAHDLNNILSAIILSVPVLREHLTQEAKEDVISTIETAASRGADIVRKVLDFARGTEPTRVQIEPPALLAEIAKIVRDTFPESIEVTVDADRCRSKVEADPTHLHQILLNLCVNARDAMPSGGELRLRCSDVILEEAYAAGPQGCHGGAHVLIEVADTGAGIPAEILHRIFDPFFTTKDPGKGTGLGLSTVQGLITDHNGFIEVESVPNRGTVFKVYLPTSGQAVMPPPPVVPQERANRELILIVDDDAGIRRVAERYLGMHGYRIMVAVDGMQAMEIFEEHGGEIAAVVTDVMMPGMNGLMLAKLLRERKPGVRIIATTGFRGDMTETQVESIDVDAWINKPFSTRKLLETIQAAVPMGSDAAAA